MSGKLLKPTPQLEKGNHKHCLIVINNLLLCSVVALIITSCGQTKPDQVAAAKMEPSGSTSNKAINGIVLRNLDDQTIDLTSYKGKTIFLNFWATWCKPCIMEMPSIERAKQILSSENFVFLAASDETFEKIGEFKEKHEFTFQFVRLESGLESLNIYSLPTTFVFSPEGELVINEVGAKAWDSPQELEQLQKLSPKDTPG